VQSFSKYINERLHGNDHVCSVAASLLKRESRNWFAALIPERVEQAASVPLSWQEFSQTNLRQLLPPSTSIPLKKLYFSPSRNL
jgi:hypothetical protein